VPTVRHPATRLIAPKPKIETRPNQSGFDRFPGGPVLLAEHSNPSAPLVIAGAGAAASKVGSELGDG